MRISMTARSVALEALQKVYAEGAYANLVLPQLLTQAKLPERDAALAQELAFSTIRWQQTYDLIIADLSSRPLTEISLSVLNCLRLGAHQLLQMRIPDHAAINETVELAREVAGERVVGFTNGILRSISRRSFEQWVEQLETSATNDVEKLAIQYSHPDWIIRALQQALKADGLEDSLETLLAINNVPALVTLIALPYLAERSQIVANGVTPTPISPYGFTLESGNPSDLPEVRNALVRVQDEGSQVAALALVSARPTSKGERWLDICAGPGGKAAVLASFAAKESIHFTANEVQEHRLQLVKGSLQQFPGTEYTNLDGRVIGTTSPNSYDRILLDAPCTGLGALRRRPEARWRKEAQDLKSLTALQYELLESAFLALKPGGLLLYVTCSPHLSETTAIVSKAVKNLNCEVLNLTEILNRDFFSGALPDNRKTVQLFTQRDQTDCMFMALISKNN